MKKKMIPKMLVTFLLMGIVATMTFYFSVKNVYSTIAPLIKIEKSGPDFADPGDMIIYTIVVENLADVSLDDVLLEDQLLGFSWHSEHMDVGEWDTFELSFMVPEDAEGSLTNIASVSAQINETVIYAEASWTTVVPVASTIDINPDTLNLVSMGKWITAYVELPEGFSVEDIDVFTIMLEYTVPVYPIAPIGIGDYDADGSPDLMVKFNRAEVIALLEAMALLDMGEVTLTITGEVDGIPFEGSDTIQVISE